MSIYFTGEAVAVAQVSTGSIDSVDATPANNTFTVTIGGVAVSVVGNTDANTTASDLVTQLQASTDPYFVQVTWSAPGSGQVRGTAKVAGVPFEATLSVSGAGTGTVTDFTDDTPSAGPSHWDSAANWSGGAVPVNTDDVIIANSSQNICYGLDQNAVTLNSLRIDNSYDGKLGLDRTIFATDVAGETNSSPGKLEYREHYLKIGVSGTIDIGQVFGPGLAAGSARLKINNVAASPSVTTVHNTRSSGEKSLPAVRLLNTDTGSDLFVRAAPGGVGIAVDEPGETADFDVVSISDLGTGTRVFCGPGATIASWEQNGGNNVLRLDTADTLTTLDMRGGTLASFGDFTITTLNMDGGTFTANHKRTGGNAVTTANLNGGEVNLRDSSEARTWATVNLGVDAVLVGDDNVTITTLNEPADPYRISVAAP